MYSGSIFRKHSIPSVVKATVCLSSAPQIHSNGIICTETNFFADCRCLMWSSRSAATVGRGEFQGSFDRVTTLKFATAHGHVFLRG
jgi:hypothetical protein